MNTNTLHYPKVANFDDQIISKEQVLFDIFCFTDRFSHDELSEGGKKTYFGKTFTVENKELYIDGELWQKEQVLITEEDFIYILPHDKLKVESIFSPRSIVDFFQSKEATFPINIDAHVTLVPMYEENNRLKPVADYRLIKTGKAYVYLNGKKVNQFDTTFQVGDRLLIDGIHLERRPKQFKVTGITREVIFQERGFLVEDYRPEYPIDFPDYRRSPRIFRIPNKEEIAISLPPPLEDVPKGEIIKTILPPVITLGAMGAMSFFTGGNPLMMLGMGAGAVLTSTMSISSYINNKKAYKEEINKREEDYDVYLFQKQAVMNRLAKEQREALYYHYPTMETLAEMTVHYHARIYEKTSNNEDFLHIALGTGSLPASYHIKFEDDEQTEDPMIIWAREQVVEPRRTIGDVPITTSLLGQTIGLVGQYHVLRTAISTLLFQVAVFHSYHDVEYVALLPEEQYEKDWHKWRWLPHFHNRALNLRGFVRNNKTRDMVLNGFYQLMVKRRQALREAGQDKPRFHPHYILTILDDSYLAGHGLNEFLAEDMSKYGVTVIWGKESQSLLPETVTTIVHYHSRLSAELVNENKVFVAKQFKPYSMPEQIAIDTAIQRLANLHHVEVEKNAIPEAVTFLDMYQVKEVEQLNVQEKWDKANTAKTLAVPLGLRGKDDLVELNLHERAHGPHGLVAGTTGSGKSEIIQSYILSLAIHFAPEDVGFLPIDFKGGGMANEFDGLPHLLGSITNLDGASSARALASIQAELNKRQALFGQYGVNHINGYTKLYKQGKTETEDKGNYPKHPLPHLFLISDEFAELKANEPEFMAELITVARIGRSLGVHLILATQKPSGVVDDQIWSNARFKLALKVADESDSNEIIKTPDAAFITQPGRAYLQVGNNEIFELFQSAWSGATYNPNIVVEEKVDERIWLINDLGQYELLSTDLSANDAVGEGSEEHMDTQLRAIVDHIAQVAEQAQAVLPKKPWLPPLETTIVTPSIDRQVTWQRARNLSVPLALLDIPSQQSQEDFLFDLEERSHTAIYGSAGFGKSTLLQTLVMNLARQNNPSHVQFHLLDFGTNGLLPLKDLPHVVDIARLEEKEKLKKFLTRIRKEIGERKDLFNQAGVGNLAQYEGRTGETLPVLITIVDAYDSLKENPLEELAEGTFNQLLRDGASVGMYLVLTALRSATLKIAMSGNIPNKIGLFLVEENAIKDVVGREALIQEEIKGRGQMKLEKPLSMQFYLSHEGDGDLQRMEALEKEVADMNESWTGERPKGIPMVPKILRKGDFFRQQQVKEFLASGNVPLGLDMETTEVVGFRPKKDAYFFILDADPAQTEYLEQTVVASFQQLAGIYQRVIFSQNEQLSQSGVFDIVVESENFFPTISQLIIECERHMKEGTKLAQPMLIYVPEVSTFMEKAPISDENLKKLLKDGQKVGIHLLLQGEKAKFENPYTSGLKILRDNIPAGYIGSRLAEQTIVKVKGSFKDPMLEPDEHHYFVGRKVEKVKLISEW